MSDEAKLAIAGAFLFGATTIVGLYLSGGAALRFGVVAASASYLAQVVEGYAHIYADRGVNVPQWLVLALWLVAVLWLAAVLSAGWGVYLAVFGG